MCGCLLEAVRRNPVASKVTHHDAKCEIKQWLKMAPKRLKEKAARAYVKEQTAQRACANDSDTE